MLRITGIRKKRVNWRKVRNTVIEILTITCFVWAFVSFTLFSIMGSGWLLLSADLCVLEVIAFLAANYVSEKEE